ncbi:glycosyltransferase [Macrococcoides bohemicum]|uniref:glycosyltransferase n=1 Tax=Macrococcoides bohemicum TaxID=1903056 RepID=UPI001C60626A|nr:glycosyltransferase [Macrococcus bohemicus]QYA44584.1 glycosyltransferase [Macrococcus bohemicus]
MKNKILLYIPFDIDGTAFNKGSSVRINNMILAFDKFAEINHYETIIIKGNQKKRGRELRQIDFNSILFIYTELPNIPLLLSDPSHIPANPYVDIYLFKQSKKFNIPIGGFLRDIYWKFDDMYPLKGLKGFTMKFLHEKYLDIFARYFDVLFVPSLEMANYLKQNFNEVIDLPPGGNVHKVNHIQDNRSDILRGVYVGSLHETSNFYELVKAIGMLKNTDNIKITVCCRKNEYDTLNKEIRATIINNRFIEIKHLNHVELSSLYENSDFSIIPYKKNIYNDFAVPVKMIEYYSYGLPILSTNINEVRKFIEKNNIGVITENYDSNSIYKGILNIKEEINSNKYIKKDMIEQFNTNHTWLKRVEKIRDSLVK